jgi:NADH:ubiquinone oxidoreductase subunit C
MSEETVVPEDSELMSIIKGWNGTIKEIKPIYSNKKSNNQVEALVDKENLLDFAEYLKGKGWDYVTSLSGVDYPNRAGEELEVVYHFANYNSPKIIVVKSRCSYEDPTMPSLYPIVKSVNFHERETHDLFGIKFKGHVKDQGDGNLPVLMLPDDWPQTPEDPPFPFRKEYVQKPRPFEMVTDTRGHQGERDSRFHRHIDRSGWLDDYYKEDSPTNFTHTKKKNLTKKSSETELSEVEDPDSEYSKKERKHF